MPEGPRGEKRPADFVGAAVKVMRIATGQEDGRISRPKDDERKDPAAVALGRKGGKARAHSLSKKERAEIAKRAARARWTR